MSDSKNTLEQYITEKLREIDSSARKTRGSGCGNEIGDVSCKYFFVECLSGDTRLHKLSGGQLPLIMRLKDLYILSKKHNYTYPRSYYVRKIDGKINPKIYKYERKKTAWEVDGFPSLYSLNIKREILIPNKIKKVIFSGEKKLYEIKTRLGFKIKVTNTHLLWTENGWNNLKQFKQNQCLGIKDWSRYIFKKRYLPREIRKFFKKLKQNSKCEKCGRKFGLEIHHKDGNFLNNKISNLQILCVDCHRVIKRGRVEKEKNYYFDKVISIKNKGIENCYDVEMEGNENVANFVAEEFIVHNCKQKHTHKNIIMDRQEDWLKLIKQLPLNTQKEAFTCIENGFGEKFIIIDSEAFFRLMNKINWEE